MRLMITTIQCNYTEQTEPTLKTVMSFFGMWSTELHAQVDLQLLQHLQSLSSMNQCTLQTSTFIQFVLPCKSFIHSKIKITENNKNGEGGLKYRVLRRQLRKQGYKFRQIQCEKQYAIQNIHLI